MKKLTFGTPEPLTPSRFCAGFNPQDTPVRYDTAKPACTSRSS